MHDSIDQKLFQGPNPQMLSQRILLGDSEMNQGRPESLHSFSLLEHQRIMELNRDSMEISPHDMQKSIRGGVRKSDYQSACDDEGEMSGKPQFLKLIIAKRMQNNFINNLWNRSYLRRLHQLSKFQIQTLDDLQLENEVYKQDENMNLETIKSFFTQIEVFTPYSKFIFIWGLFQIFTYLLIFLWLPYKISFQLATIGQIIGLSNHSQQLETILLLILSFDVVVGLNLAFIHKGIIIKERKRVIANYFKQYAFVDLVSISTVTIQFFILTEDVQGNDGDIMLVLQIMFCAVFFVLRMTKINKILAKIQEFFNLNGSLNDLVGLIKLIMIIVFFAHICACVWHGVAFYNSGFTWLDAYNLRDKNDSLKYNTAFYWATMTMTTVGYGDITAKNNLELLVNNFIMFIASIVFAYSVNSIGIFVSNMYKGTMEYSRTVTLINTYMSKNKIKFELQTRIRSYLEYIWQEEQNMNDEEICQIICKLSSHLQGELQFQLRGNILKNCKVMEKTFSEQMIKQLLSVMEEQRFSPEERIITMNQIDDCSLYIITKGEIEILFESFNSINEGVRKNNLQYLTKGDFFGELSFFTGAPRKSTAISRGFTKIFKIRRDDFLKVLQLFPNDFEKYSEIKHQLTYGDYSALQIKCYSCQSPYHIINDCNYLHFCPDKEALLKKEQYPSSQQRQRKICRTKKKKFQTRKGCAYAATRAKDYQYDYLEQPTENDEQASVLKFENDNYTYIDESKEIEAPSNQRSSSRTFSKISQKPSPPKLDEIDNGGQYTRKVVGQRGTLQTAGFGVSSNGSIRDSKKVDVITKDYEQELPISEESSSEEKDVVAQLPVLRAQNQKITFVKKESQEDIPNQTSIRSQSKTMSLIKQNQERMMRRTSTQEKGYPQEGEQAHNYKRQSIKKHSTTKTFTKQLNEPQEQNQNNSNTATIITQVQMQLSAEFEKMKTFLHFMPLSNVEMVLKRYSKLQRFFGKKKLYPEFSRYSFFFMTIKKGCKLRRLGEKLQGIKFLETNRKHYTSSLLRGRTLKKSNFINDINGGTA